MKKFLASFAPLAGIFNLIAILLSGCSLFGSGLVTLYTNRAEIAAYIEYFNSLSDDFKIELVYKSFPARSIYEKNTGPDLVLSEWLTGKAAVVHFESLEDLFKEKKGKEGLQQEAFYRDLLASGVHEKKQVLLPVSFSIPALVFRPENLSGTVPNLFLTLGYIKEQGEGFNQTVKSQFRRMGFSPLWDRSFLYDGALLEGVDFRENDDQELVWNSAALDETINYFKNWIRESNGGYEQAKEFEEKYMYEPLPRLLDSNRILFYHLESQELFQLLEEQEKEADFRWPANNSRINVNEEILYFGIPRGAKNKRGARNFLEWFFREETQQKLLEINHRKRLKSFGIAGGFSSLMAINEREFPQNYPWLIGRIPDSDFLVFPKALPADWEVLKREVIIPWLLDSTVKEGEQESLENKIIHFRSENFLN